MEIKFCKDCKWFVKRGVLTKKYFCGREVLLDTVTSKAVVECWRARLPGNFCGPEGKFFSPARIL